MQKSRRYKRKKGKNSRKNKTYDKKTEYIQREGLFQI